eukprot:gene31415-41887_t
MKAFAVLALLLGLGGYFAGAFGGAGYSRTVGKPQAQVMRALSDLDITAQPGAPGSTAAAAGGVKPEIRLETADDHMTWYVMSGKQVATRMTATFKPLDSGRQTRIEASVERGDAPDDFVSPAFRSKGLTLALFSMALEGEFNKLTAPPRADPETCARMMEQFRDGNLAAGGTDRPENLSQAMGATARTVIRLNAMEAELRRAGCPTDNDGTFHPVESHMAPAAP